MKPIIVIHGGTGDVPEDVIHTKLEGCKRAAIEGYYVLKHGATAIDAVQMAVAVMEYDPLFNAGCGSMLNLDGMPEMDALIMEGEFLNAGAVCGVQDIGNPISLARLVMEKTPHVLFAGEGAMRFAREQGIHTEPKETMITASSRLGLRDFLLKEVGSKENLRDSTLGSVGAVAIDSRGNLACATSWGGPEGRMVGRPSAACLIGSGGYADNSVGAVATTGNSDAIMKYCLAHTIIRRMATGQAASEATSASLRLMRSKLQSTGGAITLSRKGDIAIDFTAEKMAWAYQRSDNVHFGLIPGENLYERAPPS